VKDVLAEPYDPPAELPEPRTREQLKAWRQWRERTWPGTALTAREILMIERVSKRLLNQTYSLT